jgi:hypothetical protein
MGFANDQHDPASLLSLIEWIRTVTPGGAYIFAGVPSHWRDSEEDADSDERFFEVWQAVDCVSPSPPGARYRSMPYSRTAYSFRHGLLGDSPI